MAFLKGITMLTRYIVIFKDNKKTPQKYYGPFVSDRGAAEFADTLDYDAINGGYVKVRPMMTADMSHLGTRPLALA
jgi:hypothetical protein